MIPPTDNEVPNVLGPPPPRKTRRAKTKGRKRTPSVEELYGEAVKAGVVRIIRKKGRAPRIVWL